MIQVESLRILDLRGVRELNLKPECKNFVISGPNGSGKSGVVDAIQFGLTGEVSRLTGKGTSGLTVQKHGPHVDRRDDPSAAKVSLKLYFPELNKRALMTRSVKTSATYDLEPDDPAARAILDEVARHPELTLSRREIIKYILVEAGERSKQIQALLKLDEIGQIRSVLATARNRVVNAFRTARQDTANAADALRRHLDLRELSADDILAPVNAQRAVLGLSAIPLLTSNAILNAGAPRATPQPAFSKAAATRDLAAFQSEHDAFATLGADESSAILSDIATLESDPPLLDLLTRHSFLERGLDLIDGSRCPLCDQDWNDEGRLRTHLQTKIAKSEQAEAVQRRLLDNAAAISRHARRVVSLLERIQPLAESDGPSGLAEELSLWAEGLTTFASSLTTTDQILLHRPRFQLGWIAAPESLTERVKALTETIRSKPDQTASAAASAYLTLAEDRLNTYRQAKRAEERARDAADLGKLVYTTYCDVADRHLSQLYAAVETDFSDFYRRINGDDEIGFKARLEPAEGKLDLEVAFYDRGMFPPGAYHSEGHQDGMGVSLYLALMKRLLGDRFRFAVLDDVVMSVDQDHRKQFCGLLKSLFPSTQFIITTHDRVWAKQMQTESLVEPKSGVAFHSWSVQTGPIFEEVAEIWDQVDGDLEKIDVETAAFRLRRHLEYTAAELADRLGAQPAFRGDLSYDVGDLLPAVIGRQGALVKMAAKSASDWKDDEAKAKVDAMKTARADVLRKYGGEQWIINKAVHYNEWANISTSEFRAVVAAFRALLQHLRCAKCQSLVDSYPFVRFGRVKSKPPFKPCVRISRTRLTGGRSSGSITQPPRTLAPGSAPSRAGVSVPGDGRNLSSTGSPRQLSDCALCAPCAADAVVATRRCQAG